jgi:DNA mismatch repair protein MutS2
MQPPVFRALEFDRIRGALAREAATALGRARAVALGPATDLPAVRQRLDLTVEAAGFAKAGGSLAIDAPDDLTDILAALDVADQPLLPAHLLGLARFTASVSHVVDRVRAARAPLLVELVAPARSFIAETEAVQRAIVPPGDVADAASPVLADIRDALRRQRGKLRSTLEHLTRGRETAKYLQDQIVSDRNGRYVIVVRSEHRDAIPGIVHGASASGASLYLEPMATVALNNEIVALAEREREEVHRILIALTDAFRGRADEFEALLDVAGGIDELCAKVRLAARVDGIAPELVTGGHLEFLGARHPLLIPSVRDLLADDSDEPSSGPAVVVASDLIVRPPAQALVISGPNTGGKTVALKAFGLLALMAQSGLLIPVEPGSRLTPFRTVFADIGDEQSIAASLSTFSARIANLVAIERSLEAPALVLLDEVGGGTDPVEGGALGIAVIDHLRRRGATVVATTHDDAVKSYAATTDGVASGAFGFNPETFAPTFSLRYGTPGRSLALEVARRLGLPAAVIADAESRRSGRESLLAAHLARLDRQLAAVEDDRQRARAEREQAAAERQRVLEREARLAEREAVIRKRLDDKLAERLREARAEVDAVVTRLKSKADALAEQVEHRAHARARVLPTGEVGSLRSEARDALSRIEADVVSGESSGDADRRLDRPPVAGDRVVVAAFGGAEGIVRGLSGQHAEVDVRGKRMRVPLDGLRKAATAHEASKPSGRSTLSSGKSVTAPAAAPARELVVVGSTVDAAIDRVEKFLDQALLADERSVRIVHGRGTGKLREALRTYLSQHPIVARVASAGEREGGDAATVVELRD